MLSYKKVLTCLLAIVLGSYSSCTLALSDEYSIKNIIDAKEVSETATSEDYDLIYSMAMVSKGASGYKNNIYLTNLYSVLEKAHNDKQLTNDGTVFYNAVKEIKQFLKHSSPTKLTERGGDLLSDLGANYAKNRKHLLLENNYENEITISFSYNGDMLSLSTGEKFILGMTRNLSDETQIVYIQDDDATQKNIEKVLSFYDTNEYTRYLSSYPALVGAIGKHQVTKQTVTYSEALINRIFKKNFAESFIHMGVMPDKTILSKIEIKDFTKYVYDLYTFLPSLSDSLAKKYQATFDAIMPSKERLYWSVLDDASLFYKYGPGFKNQEISKKSASKVFELLKQSVDNFVQGNTEETIKLFFVDYKLMLSFLSFLKGDELGAPLEINELFNIHSNTFKASKLAPLNSILIIDLFKDKKGSLFFRIKHNGNEMLLKSSCGEADKAFYELKNIEQCLLNIK